jgi:multiple sugar transport system substrate-binding protein
MDESRLTPHDVESGTLTRRKFVKRTGAAGLLVAAGGAFAPSARASGRGAAVRSVTRSAPRLEPPPADTKARLTTFNYGDAAYQKIYADAIGRFNQRYPNVTVKDNYTSFNLWSEYADKLTTQVAGGQTPDLIHVAIEGTRLVVAKGLMEPLDDYIAADADMQNLLNTEMAQPLKDAFTVDGKLYQIPVEWNNMVIFYNTKLFADAGLTPPVAEWTWDDFLNAAKALTKGSGGDKVYGFGIPFFTFGLVPWFLTNSTYPLTDDWSDSNLNDPKVLETVTFLHDLIHVHEVSPVVEVSNINDQLFPAGKLAMSGWGRWPLPGFIGAEFKDFDIQYWPRKTAATSIHGIGGWGISPKSENKALAWELVKEVTTRQVNDDIVKAGVSIPAIRSSAETPEFLSFPPNAKIYYESLNDTKPVPSPANFSEFESIFIRHLQEILTGATSPADGLAAAHDELSAAMAKLKS